jgi:hypothetical protein
VLLRGPGPLDLVLAAAGIGLFAAAYRLLGHPFSFSCVNDAADTPRFIAEVCGLAALGAVVGGLAATSGPRYARACLLAGGIAAAATGAVSGPTAASALDHPAAAYLYDLSLSYVFSVGLLVAIAAAIVKVHGPPAEEGKG